jgi:hypothetical protein
VKFYRLDGAVQGRGADEEGPPVGGQAERAVRARLFAGAGVFARAVCSIG